MVQVDASKEFAFNLNPRYRRWVPASGGVYLQGLQIPFFLVRDVNIRTNGCTSHFSANPDKADMVLKHASDIFNPGFLKMRKDSL